LYDITYATTFFVKSIISLDSNLRYMIYKRLESSYPSVFE